MGFFISNKKLTKMVGIKKPPYQFGPTSMIIQSIWILSF